MDSLDHGVVRLLVARRAAWRSAIAWLLLVSVAVAAISALML